VRIDVSLPSIAIKERAAAEGPRGRSTAAPDGFRDNRVDGRGFDF
jgi:hypothetical protein